MEQQMIKYAEQGNIEETLALVDAGVNINVTDTNGRTAVMAATYNNEVEIVKRLIERGADINIRDKQLNNVLLYAGASGYLSIVKLAIEAGAATTITNRFGGIAIIPAAERGHVEIVKELLENSDTNVNHINNLHWTALMEAVILGDGGKRHQQIVQLLIEHGADIHIADAQGITPLEHARKLGFTEIEKILTAAGE
ncbi:ankyrin repeat domain-containing protein [Metasolibacillus meyeri]|uniref:Ankyrin repeat domain-containing protein n=1 Tax=Metasolibacillus meyeri TaxID=1071052 RepID=A0AAW9NUK2_9BACL|nr:ankyrin repeat domain-containing protein [Metasolibacillus meyeri]MEC1179525.1 ankyrin repeat domain-containing protein [Metasolibacillus meyeri]